MVQLFLREGGFKRYSKSGIDYLTCTIPACCLWRRIFYFGYSIALLTVVGYIYEKRIVLNSLFPNYRSITVSNIFSRLFGTTFTTKNIPAIKAPCMPHEMHMTKERSRKILITMFMEKVLDSYLVVGAMQHHGMECMEYMEDTPTKNLYEESEIDAEKKTMHVHEVIKSFIEEHVVNQVPELSRVVQVSNAMECRFCGKKYVQKTAPQNHEKNKHDFTVENSGNSNNGNAPENRVYNYTHTALVLLLLRLNHDAIRLADGERIRRLYKLFCLYFKTSKCPKYAYAMLHYQAQVNCLLSPRLAHSLVWNRFVNTKGLSDTNYPMDLYVEHDNETFKDDIHIDTGVK